MESEYFGKAGGDSSVSRRLQVAKNATQKLQRSMFAN